MIYVLSTNEKINQIVANTSDMKTVVFEDILHYFKDVDIIAYDSETTGLIVHVSDLICIQIGDANNQFVIDVQTIDIRLFKSLLENKVLCGHNMKFDLKFLYQNNIWPTKVFDTYLAEKTLYLGIDSHRASLSECVFRYFGLILSKEERNKIDGNYTPGFIRYSALDVKYLLELRIKQLKLLKNMDALESIGLDNKFVIVLAYIEFCGIKLDEELWQHKMETTECILKYECLELLNQFIIQNNITTFINTQSDLFSSGIKVNINWDSPNQVAKFFRILGIDVEIMEKGVKKTTVDASHISKYKDKFPIINTYLKYKEYQKDFGTYGQSFLDCINPITGRIHTQFKQLMATGRLSCGGKDKNANISYPNLQNIPSDKETRQCFVAETGNVLVGSDYSGQEQIVLANKSLDPSLLEFYDKGLADMHSFVCSKIYPELEGLSLQEISKKHKDKRQIAKSAGFAINYGGQGQTIADNLGISVEQGNEIYKAYFEAFPGLKDYFDANKKIGISKGYVLISAITGKRSFVPFYEEFVALQKTLDKKFWDEYKLHKKSNSPTFRASKEKVSKYFKKRGDIERMSLNYCIQGESAEITKLAGVYFFENYIRANNLIGKVKIVNCIHDEYLVECPENIAEEVAQELKAKMEDAGDVFCKRIKLKADPTISKCWTK